MTTVRISDASESAEAGGERETPAPSVSADPAELFVQRLSGHFEIRPLREELIVCVHLDTADRRLAKADLSLWLERPTCRLVLERPDGQRLGQPVGRISWPARLDVVSSGAVREAIAEAVGIRALLPYAEVTVSTATYAVLNGDGKTVARLRRSRGRLPAPHPPLPDRIDVERLRGYDTEADQVIRRLRLAESTSAGRRWAQVIRAIPVPGQTVTSPARMTADEPAAAAVAGALLGNLAELQAAVDGIRRDLDIEYLHDFRVAVRRSRSVLKLLGDALPVEAVEQAVSELRWLGQVTTQPRDLDVYLHELPELARGLVRPADLDPFAAHVAQKRRTAYTALRRALSSKRFVDFCDQWRTTLTAIVDAPDVPAAPGSPDGPDGPGARTAGVLADERIHRTFGKVAKRARAIGPASHSEEIHDLRKACKELRYVLEVFRPLCDPAVFKAVTSDFKALQGVLGDFQDGEVQANALRDFADEMLSARSATAATLLTMGELAARFDERQRSARARLLDQHLTHLGRSVARHIDHVVATRPA